MTTYRRIFYASQKLKQKLAFKEIPFKNVDS